MAEHDLKSMTYNQLKKHHDKYRHLTAQTKAPSQKRAHNNTFVAARAELLRRQFAKEEVQLDELSVQKVAAYGRAATKDKSDQDNQMKYHNKALTDDAAKNPKHAAIAKWNKRGAEMAYNQSQRRQAGLRNAVKKTTGAARVNATEETIAEGSIMDTHKVHDIHTQHISHGSPSNVLTRNQFAHVEKDGNHSIIRLNDAGQNAGTMHSGSKKYVKSKWDNVKRRAPHITHNADGKGTSKIRYEETRLDELKKTTLANYTKKAARDLYGIGRTKRHAVTDQDAKQNRRDHRNRLRGIDTATKKLASESSQLDELSPTTLKKYTNKAADSLAANQTTGTATGKSNSTRRKRIQGIEKATARMGGNKDDAFLVSRSAHTRGHDIRNKAIASHPFEKGLHADREKRLRTAQRRHINQLSKKSKGYKMRPTGYKVAANESQHLDEISTDLKRRAVAKAKELSAKSRKLANVRRGEAATERDPYISSEIHKSSDRYTQKSIKKGAQAGRIAGSIKRSSVNETLTSRTPTGKWIKDFEKSDAPQFKGKSKSKRREMAIAASVSAKNESVDLTEGKRPLRKPNNGSTAVARLKKFDQSRVAAGKKPIFDDSKKQTNEGFKYGPGTSYHSMSSKELEGAKSHAAQHRKPGHLDLINDIIRKRRQQERKKTRKD